MCVIHVYIYIYIYNHFVLIHAHIIILYICTYVCMYTTCTTHEYIHIILKTHIILIHAYIIISAAGVEAFVIDNRQGVTLDILQSTNYMNRVNGDLRVSSDDERIKDMVCRMIKQVNIVDTPADGEHIRQVDDILIDECQQGNKYNTNDLIMLKSLKVVEMKTCKEGTSLQCYMGPKGTDALLVFVRDKLDNIDRVVYLTGKQIDAHAMGRGYITPTNAKNSRRIVRTVRTFDLWSM